MAKRRKVRRQTRRKGKSKPKRKSVAQIWTGLQRAMKRADFHIGGEFLTAAGRWRCTDIGKRTVVAIRLNHDDEPNWYNGPPYAVAETVFDEYDFEGCEPAPERRTYDASASELPPVRRRKRRRGKKPAVTRRPRRNGRRKGA